MTKRTIYIGLEYKFASSIAPLSITALTGCYRQATDKPRNAEITVKSDSQKAAEADVDGFRKDLGPFVVAAEMTRMAMVFTDAKETGNPIICANDAFLELISFR
jgi:hypothetical protein